LKLLLIVPESLTTTFENNFLFKNNFWKVSENNLLFKNNFWKVSENNFLFKNNFKKIVKTFTFISKQLVESC